jgi:hypothetical protein
MKYWKMSAAICIIYILMVHNQDTEDAAWLGMKTL